MTDAAKRFYCRAGFTLLCALPTLLMLGWIIVRGSPLYAGRQERAWRQALSQSLGLTAQVEEILEPRPGHYVLKQVTLRDPDASSDSLPLAKAKRVEVAHGPTGLVILASEAEVPSGELPRLWAILHERLIRGPELAENSVHLNVSSVTLTAPASTPERALTLADLRLQLLSSQVGARGSLEFRLAGEAGEPVRLSVARNRERQPVATDWSLHSGATPLPCSALATCLPALAVLGNEATFHGVVTLQTHDTTWDARLSGDFQKVNLDALVTDLFPQHQLSGKAAIVVSDARWQAGKLASIAGSVHSEGGSVSQSLLESARTVLGMVPMTTSERPTPLRRYHELAFGFALDGNELRFAGLCHGRTPETILADRDAPLLLASAQQVLPPLALVEALVPEASSHLPARAEAVQLAHFIPLPEEPHVAERPERRAVKLKN